MASQISSWAKRLSRSIGRTVQVHPKPTRMLVVWALVGAAIGLSQTLAPNSLRWLVVFVLLGVAGSLLSWLLSSPGDLKGLGIDLGTELIGAVVIYVLLELAVGGAEELASQRARLISEMGSKVNDVAVVATEKLRQHGWLTDGTLRGADFMKADLELADLELADLQGASLHEANLQEAILRDANLQRASLYFANLQGTDLISADLQGADLYLANLQRADLRDANLQRTHLHFTDLQGANLARTDLQGANLLWTDLQGASLYSANLQGAILLGANLQDADLGRAEFDENTTLPDGTRWTPDTDIARFTDPDHPEFGRSDDPSSPAYRGKDGD